LTDDQKSLLTEEFERVNLVKIFFSDQLKMGKKLIQDALQSYPDPSPTQVVVKIISTQGGNLFKVQGRGVDLVSLPNKFQKSLWIRRGSFVIVEPCVSDTKVNGEIVAVLMSIDIKELKRLDKWPVEFMEECNSESSDDDDLFVNRNRDFDDSE
jgi:probable RNA-binding protein EIF1AD